MFPGEDGEPNNFVYQGNYESETLTPAVPEEENDGSDANLGADFDCS